MGKAEWSDNPVCWWLGLYSSFVCCLDEASCTGCYWWLGDAGSCIQVVSFMWARTHEQTLRYTKYDHRTRQIKTRQKKPHEFKTWHHPTTSSILWRMPHLNNKQNKNTNPIISRQDYHSLSLFHQRKNKQTQTKTQHKSHLIPSLHKPLDQPQEGRNQKEEIIQPSSRKEFNFPWSLGKGDPKHNKLKN